MMEHPLKQLIQIMESGPSVSLGLEWKKTAELLLANEQSEIEGLADRYVAMEKKVVDLNAKLGKALAKEEELLATIEELEQTAEAAKPQTLLDEQKAEILKKLTVLDLETLQHLESVLGLQFAPPYS